MSEEKAMIRVWAVVKDEDGYIVADVRDEAEFVFTEGDSSYRVWRACVVGSEESEDCDPVVPCRPGKPCTKCQKVARSWWNAWEDKENDRYWQGSNEPEGFKGWSLSHWCSHRHRKKEAALKCAKKGGFARIILFNGHGKRLDTQGLPLC